MTRATVELPDKLHNGLKQLADQRHVSVAELLRDAAEEIYREDIADLRTGHQRLSEYRSGAVVAESYATYRTKRLKER